MAAKRTNHSREYIKSKIIGWSRNVIVPLYTALGWPHLESSVNFGRLNIWTSISGVYLQESGQAEGERTQGQDLREALRSLDLRILEKWRLGGSPLRWSSGGGDADFLSLGTAWEEWSCLRGSSNWSSGKDSSLKALSVTETCSPRKWPQHKVYRKSRRLWMVF